MKGDEGEEVANQPSLDLPSTAYNNLCREASCYSLRREFPPIGSFVVVPTSGGLMVVHGTQRIPWCRLAEDLTRPCYNHFGSMCGHLVGIDVRITWDSVGTMWDSVGTIDCWVLNTQSDRTFEVSLEVPHEA